MVGRYLKVSTKCDGAPCTASCLARQELAGVFGWNMQIHVTSLMPERENYKCLVIDGSEIFFVQLMSVTSAIMA